MLRFCLRLVHKDLIPLPRKGPARPTLTQVMPGEAAQPGLELTLPTLAQATNPRQWLATYQKEKREEKKKGKKIKITKNLF